MITYKICGDLTQATVPEQLPKLSALMSTNAEVTFNLADLHRVDSAGIAFFLELVRIAQKNSHKVYFVLYSEKLNRLKKIYGLENLLAQQFIPTMN